MILYTQLPLSKRPSIQRRHSSMRLNLKYENMDLASFTRIRRGRETYLNTRRNGSPADRMPSSSSMFSFSSLSLSAGSSLFSTTTYASSETVSSFSSMTSNASTDLSLRKEKKVRFAHPVVTAVFDDKVDEKRIRFAVPLTNIPLRSREERTGLRLPGTCYDVNNGPICDDAPRHYKRMCLCDFSELEEYVECSDAEARADDVGSSDEEAEDTEAEDVDLATFKYHGPLFHDSDDDMFP